MRNLVIVTLIAFTCSCSKIKCIDSDIWLSFSADTIQPSTSSIKIKTFSKGTDWGTPISTQVRDNNFNASSNVLMISSNNDYIVEVDSPFKQYKITDINHGEDKTYETGIGQRRMNCTNSMSYSVNGSSVYIKMATGSKLDFAKQYITLSRY